MKNISDMTKKRLKGDMKLLKKDPHPYFEAYPETMLEWWFILKGHEISDFKGGFFIGKIIHDIEYPLKPPDFMMLTPNGRFDIEQKICLSNTGYHSNEWSAMWNINAILSGFLSIMLDDNENGISHIHLSKEEREDMAKKSIEFNKTNYKSVIAKFTRFLDESGDPIEDTKEETN
jgi:ubiquitin-protein ligase